MNKHKHKIFTFAALMTTATVVVHFINRTIAATAQLKQLLGLADSRTFEWRFGNINYTKKGSGSPVLLIHDVMPGASGYEWNRIEDSLAADHTVYTIELLGCGRSEKPGITYTNFVYVQMICDFIRKVIGQKTDVIASGLSGSFVVMACHNEKELFMVSGFLCPITIVRLFLSSDIMSSSCWCLPKSLLLFSQRIISPRNIIMDFALYFTFCSCAVHNLFTTIFYTENVLRKRL